MLGLRVAVLAVAGVMFAVPAPAKAQTKRAGRRTETFPSRCSSESLHVERLCGRLRLSAVFRAGSNQPIDRRPVAGGMELFHR
jgi:hypothetical protein